MPEKKKAYVASAYGSVEPSEAAGGTVATTLPETGSDNGHDGDETQRPAAPAVLPGILGKQLRAAYGELLNSPVPDRFNDLINKLQRQESDAAGKNKDEEEAS